ncbi:hypothetical protein [Vibrio ulleungensis]|jgi:hypothetical protein|uniref:Uncharacterized protein n=1 Tax=Vibrio ulleungensis TaxID=2807619 RepID=A0ABS2HMP7_9VIBR|nr:hypothetical protein [Vibrio ulleungensis]MBM7037167.1 hypothetical protein [Vibrio ulleungensis]
MDDKKDNRARCCARGGPRPGCGRKPGIKTRPVRLPEWLLDELESFGDPRQSIIEACKAFYGIDPQDAKLSNSSESHDQN